MSTLTLLEHHKKTVEHTSLADLLVYRVLERNNFSCYISGKRSKITLIAISKITHKITADKIIIKNNVYYFPDKKSQSKIPDKSSFLVSQENNTFKVFYKGEGLYRILPCS